MQSKMPQAATNSEHKEGKASRKENLRKIAQLIEEDMSERGLSEAKKNERVKRFTAAVSRLRKSS